MKINILKEDFEKYAKTLMKIKEEEKIRDELIDDIRADFEKSTRDLKDYKYDFEETLKDNVEQMIGIVIEETNKTEVSKILGCSADEKVFERLNIRQDGLLSFHCAVNKIEEINEDEVVFEVEQYATHGEYDYGELYVPMKVINEFVDRNYVLNIIETLKKEKEEYEKERAEKEIQSKKARYKELKQELEKLENELDI